MCCEPRVTCGCFHPHPYSVMGRPFEHRSLLHHRYYSREDTLEELKEDMGELEKELQWVRERISELEKKK